MLAGLLMYSSLSSTVHDYLLSDGDTLSGLGFPTSINNNQGNRPYTHPKVRQIYTIHQLWFPFRWLLVVLSWQLKISRTYGKHFSNWNISVVSQRFFVRPQMKHQQKQYQGNMIMLHFLPKNFLHKRTQPLDLWDKLQVGKNTIFWNETHMHNI